MLDNDIYGQLGSKFYCSSYNEGCGNKFNRNKIIRIIRESRQNNIHSNLTEKKRKNTHIKFYNSGYPKYLGSPELVGFWEKKHVLQLFPVELIYLFLSIFFNLFPSPVIAEEKSVILIHPPTYKRYLPNFIN
jgi:hypothetical protein